MKISWGMLREAVGVYLQCAYPTGQVPAVVQQRIGFDESRSLTECLGAPPFENYVATAPFQCTVHALRLGSIDYPNLKLEIRPFPSREGFVFWVNTHDQFVAVTPNMPDAEAWGAVVRRNRDLKQQVEREWASRKLPTFTTVMQQDLADPPER
jgi:hypothetical protein